MNLINTACSRFPIATSLRSAVAIGWFVLAGSAQAADIDVNGIDFQPEADTTDAIFQDSYEKIDALLRIVGPCCAPYSLTPGLPVRIPVGVKHIGDDPLQFTLLSGPPEMTINASTGTVLWTPSDSDRGSSIEVLVSVTDGTLVAQKAFDVTVLDGTPIQTTNSGTVTTVTEAGNLNGLTFDVPTSSLDPKTDQPLPDGGIAFSSVDESLVPAIPSGVTRLTDFFFTDGIVASEPIAVTFPEFTLPEGRRITELQLYSWSKDEVEFFGPGWWGSNLGFSVSAGQLSLVQFGSGQIMFIGLPPAAPSALINSAGKDKNADASATAVTSGITCTPGKYYPISYDSYPLVVRSAEPIDEPDWTACTADIHPDWMVQIQDLSTEGIWILGTTVETLAAWLAQGRSELINLGMVSNDNLLVRIERFNAKLNDCKDGVTDGAVLPNDSFELLRLNSYDICNQELIPATAFKYTSVHEYFHHSQHLTGASIAGSGQRPILTTKPADDTSWLTEGTAEWFEDEVFDDDDPYQLLTPLDSYLRTGLNAKREKDFPYKRFSFFKYLTESCTTEAIPALFAVPEAYSYGDPALHRLIEELLAWTCNFSDGFGPENKEELSAALLDYQLQTLLIENPTEKFGEVGSANLKFDRDVGDVQKPANQPGEIQEWEAFNQEPSKIIDMERNSAFSFYIDEIPGTLKPSQTFNVVLEVIGGDLLAHVLFVDQFDQARTFWKTAPSDGSSRLLLSYDEFAGGKVPLLFVTLVNPPSEEPDTVTVSIGWELIETNEVDLSGSWLWTETEREDNCGDPEATLISEVIITQYGRSVQLCEVGWECFDGELIGNTVNWEADFVENGVTKTQSMTGTVSSDGNSITGSGEWSSDACSGSFNFTAERSADFTGTILMSGDETPTGGEGCQSTWIWDTNAKAEISETAGLLTLSGVVSVQSGQEGCSYEEETNIEIPLSVSDGEISSLLDGWTVQGEFIPDGLTLSVTVDENDLDEKGFPIRIQGSGSATLTKNSE